MNTQTKKAYLKITTIKQLKEECNGKDQDFFLWFGGLKSSKTIQYDEDEDSFWIFNDIDGSQQDVKTKDLVNETNIVKAIYEGYFYSYKLIDKPIDE